MAEYGVEPNQEMYGEEKQNGEYNDYGAEQNAMEFDTDVPVSQEDAWAVIS
jgi:hypothetical protein